jgi:hypothetical protein
MKQTNHAPDRSVREGLLRLRAENLSRMKDQVRVTTAVVPGLLNLHACTNYYPKTTVLGAAALSTVTTLGVARALGGGRGRRRGRGRTGGGSLRLFQFVATLLPHLLRVSRGQAGAQSSAELVEHEVFLGHA